MNPAYIAELKHAIKQVHGCDSTHVETVPVTEKFRGKIVWEGEVEVFNLAGHPKAKRAYAWGYAPDRSAGLEVVAVLEIPPVESPVTAVRAAIVAEAKAKK